MRILHVINNLNTGGAEKLLLDTIPLFNAKGLETDLLVLDGTEYPYLSELKRKNCSKIYSLDSKFIYNPINIIKIIPILKEYDVIHVHLFPAQYWVVLAKVVSISKCKLVFTEHNTTNRRMQNTLFKYFERFIYKGYDKIICISEEISQILVNYSQVNKEKFTIVKNGINLETFTNANKIEWKDLSPKLQDSDQIIIQVAGFRPQKDQETTIKSLLLLPSNVKLVLAGDGEKRKELENLAKTLKLEDRVVFLGVRLDVPDLLKSSDISVISSHWEGMPLSVIEGMAVNIPVVASNVPGVNQLVENVGVLFEKGNVNQLAEIINNLLNDRSYYNQVSKSCYEHSKQFDINKMINSTIAIYERL